MLQDEDPLAIPLWINGHAFLTMAPAFQNVCNPVSGKVLRRTPLCGRDEALQAVAAAQAALADWRAMPETARAALLAAVAEALSSYAEHFARLIGEESGKESSLALSEVDQSVALLRNAASGRASGVVGIVGDSSGPLLNSLQLAVPALMAGAVVVMRPAPETPSALFALAELTGRCGFPDGVFNILQGGDAAVDGLRAASGVSLFFAQAGGAE